MIGVLLLLAGSVAVRLQEIGEVELDVALEIATRVSHRIQARAGTEAVIDDPIWLCDRTDHCVTEILARTGTTEVLLLRALGGPTKIQLEAKRAGDRAVVRIPLEPEGWEAPIAELVSALFEAAPDPPPPPPPPEKPAPAVLPWVLIGTGVVAAAIATGLTASSDAASDEIRGGILYGERHRELARRQRNHGLAANVLFGTAAASALAGTVLIAF